MPGACPRAAVHSELAGCHALARLRPRTSNHRGTPALSPQSGAKASLAGAQAWQQDTGHLLHLPGPQAFHL